MSEKSGLSDTYISEEGMVDLWNVWYSELHDGQSGLTVKVDRIAESIKSDFQRIDVLETKDFGKMLVLYGSLMVCDADHNAYNEMITHVPLFSHPAPKRVLIIGGGDCGALTEVMKHPEVEKCTMCEIDRVVIETSQRHFPYLCTGLEDPRADLIFCDGKKYIEESDEKFDIIILDLSDPVGPAADLFQKSFHAKVFERLNDDGILVAQTESPFYNQNTVSRLFSNLRDLFPVVSLYTCFMPIYPSGFWSFGFCSKQYRAIEDFQETRYTELALKTRYYNDEVHRAAFALPQFVRELIEQDRSGSVTS